MVKGCALPANTVLSRPMPWCATAAAHPPSSRRQAAKRIRKSRGLSPNVDLKVRLK